MITISNPPYSVRWEDVEKYKNEPRFSGYQMPPASKADFGFILDAISRAGEYHIEILPHGVLFRGQKEGEIRKQLLENGMIDTVIGLPENMFQNTSIPVCMIIIKKSMKNKDVYFIDASKDFVKGKKTNYMNSEQVTRVVTAVRERKEIERFAHLATLKEIRDNDYNLNIPRYVDTFEHEESIDLQSVLEEMINIDREIKDTEKSFMDMLRQLVGTTPKAAEELAEIKKQYEQLFERGENGQMEMNLWKM